MAAYDQDDAEPPLDPAAERLRRRLARLLAISGGFMVLGFIAVFAAIVYKLGGRDLGRDGAPAGSVVTADIPTPPGSRLVGADLAGDRALLRLELPDGGVSLVLVDLPSGAVMGRYGIVPEE